MKALVKTTPVKGVTLQTLKRPLSEPQDTLVALSKAGICGNDVSIFLWKEGYRHLPLPVILGHEFSGRVLKKGKMANGINEGDRVTVNPVISCGKCQWCRSGATERCESKSIMGLTHNGCFSEYILIPGEASIFKLPEAISDELGALIEPICVAYHAIEVSRFKSQDDVAVFGMGPIGLMMVCLLRQLGAKSVLIVGRSTCRERADMATDLGADRVVDIHHELPLQVAREMTEGTGADIVFEATGNSSVVPMGLEALREGGQMVLCGIFEGKGEIELTKFVREKKGLLGSHAYDDQTWEKVINLLSDNEMPFNRLITNVLPLSRGIQAFDAMINRQGVKFLLEP